MGRKSELTFFQSAHADGRQTHEKMLNMANHQGSGNQNHDEISLHICQNGYHQKEHRDFPDGPLVKTPHFHCRGHGLHPLLGN